MMTRFLFTVLVVLTATPIQFAQQPRTAEASKQIKIGDMTRLDEDLAVKVTTSPAAAFGTVSVKGQSLVVVIEMDAGKKAVTLSYKATPDSRSSDLYLTSGNARFAPRAVIEDFPSWGSDNDKEVEVLDPKDSAGESDVEFEGKGSILLLFDVPEGQARAAKALSVTIRTIKPKAQQHSFVVNL
jgi:hypothetical protein